MLLLSLFLTACSGTVDDTAEAEAAPTIAFLSPADGEMVVAGDVSVSVIVENFALEAPAKHNEGEAEGYIRVTVDGAEVLTTAETQFIVTLDPTPEHTIGAELLFADGDELEPAVSAEIGVTIATE
jgi:hypothetical protein